MVPYCPLCHKAQTPTINRASKRRGHPQSCMCASPHKKRPRHEQLEVHLLTWGTPQPYIDLTPLAVAPPTKKRYVIISPARPRTPPEKTVIYHSAAVPGLGMVMVGAISPERPLGLSFSFPPPPPPSPIKPPPIAVVPPPPPPPPPPAAVAAGGTETETNQVLCRMRLPTTGFSFVFPEPPVHTRTHPFLDDDDDYDYGRVIERTAEDEAFLEKLAASIPREPLIAL